MIKIALFALLLSIVAFAFSPSLTLAQQGCCSWHGGISYCDSSVGRYVCNDGTYSPTCTCPITPPPPPPQCPTKASWTFNPNENGTYDINFTWDDLRSVGCNGVSISINNYMGADPGPLIDTYSNSWVFHDVLAGMWYVNLKGVKNNTWSTVAYWTIIVPEWVSPTPIPTLVVDTSTSNKSFISSFFEWLFSWGKSKNTTILVPTPKPVPYVCNCAKTCTQISTCTEAYYQLNTCGCSVRDGDDDGIPCENLCR